MARKLIVHAGMPRAGSSTIQEALFRQRKKLEAAGLLYAALDIVHAPDGKPGEIYNHRQLCQSAEGLFWPSRRFQLLHDEIAGLIAASSAPLAMLSYEGWWDPRNHRALKRTMKTLRKKLPGTEITVAAVVREPVSFLLSLYKLDVLYGRTALSFEEYWPRKLHDPRLHNASIARSLGSMADGAVFAGFEEASQGGRLVGNVLGALGAEGVFQRAGLARPERHRSPGGAFFSDQVITMMRFAAHQIGLRAVKRLRPQLQPLMKRTAETPELVEDCKALVIPLSSRAAAAITAATRPETEVLYPRWLNMVQPPPPQQDDRLTQSEINGSSALGQALLKELEGFRY